MRCLQGISRASLKTQCTAFTPLVGFIQEPPAQQAPQTSLCTKKRHRVFEETRKVIPFWCSPWVWIRLHNSWGFIYILKFSSGIPVLLRTQKQQAIFSTTLLPTRSSAIWCTYSSPGTLWSRFSTLWSIHWSQTSNPSPLPSSLIHPHRFAQLCLLLCQQCGVPFSYMHLSVKSQSLTSPESPVRHTVTLFSQWPLVSSQIWLSPSLSFQTWGLMSCEA